MKRSLSLIVFSLFALLWPKKKQTIFAWTLLSTCHLLELSHLLTDLNLIQISVLMGEPYFSTSLLPWHSLFFWYCRTALAGLLQPNATILPCSATLHIVAVEFQVGQTGTFSLTFSTHIYDTLKHATKEHSLCLICRQLKSGSCNVNC